MNEADNETAFALVPNEGGKSQRGLIVVAIGGSGAAVGAIDRLLGAFDPPEDAATILVLQHREAVDEARIQKLTAARNVSLSAVEDDALIEPGKLYLSSPNVILTMHEGRFHTREAQNEPGLRGTIDSFFVSLAEEKGERAIGVVLQGTSGDGTLGIASLKEQGGLTIAERGPTETANEIALSNAPGALADVLLPAEDIPGRIAAYIAQLKKSDAQQKTEEVSAGITAALGRVATILRNKTGHDFHGYKTGTFMRRVQRRMQVVQVDDVEAYLDFLRDNPDETQNLFNDLLIGVTQFFRDLREFETLEKEVIPKLFEGKGPTDQLRVWVMGCATGEEAYSIGILLREQMARVEEVPHIQIFATDIDVRALAAARVGRFPKSIAADLTPERLARWFVKEGDTYCVVKELREMCIFSSHNVIKDAPFSRLDLISCRNLLIYLNTELQSRVIPLFHFALQPKGYLFLGNSENASRHAKLFEPLDRRCRIFRRLQTATRVLPDFPITTLPAHRPIDAAATTRPRLSEGVLARQAERIVERFAPAYVIVNEQLEIVHFSGRMGRYLDPSSGAASLDLLNLVHRDLRVDLRVAMQGALEQNQITEVAGVEMQIDGANALVEISVEPIRDMPQGARHLTVVFRDGVLRPPGEFGHSVQQGRGRDEHIERLETELRLSRDRLQATIEELESTNEELKSSNEEYQSLNEELQSANEELETSKEELQSVNEELTTVNGELAHRVHDLTRATSDLKNFLESTQIATLFLDNDLNVMNFTPAATELFHLVETDIGRPLAHIKARIPVEALFDDVRKVMRTLASVEHAVEDVSTAARYIVRILPYRSVDNFIAGVVVTFTNVTALTRAEQALRESEARFRAIFDNAAEYAIITMDGDRRITGWNPGARNLLGWDAGDVIGREGDIIFTEEDRAAGAPEREQETAARDGSAADERWHVRRDGSRFWASGTLRRVEEGQLAGYLKIMRDRTEARQAEERQQLLLAELQHRVRNTLAVVRSIVRMTAGTSTSVSDYAKSLDGRLKTFARVQTALTRDPSAGVDLAEIVREEVRAYSAETSERITINGPPLRLLPKAAEAFALGVHELATNAVKHGALSGEAGLIDVRWRIVRDKKEPRLMFTWTENGVEPKTTGAPPRRGFGTDLLERNLAYQIGSTTTLNFADDGMLCTIEVPLTDGVVLGLSEG